VRSAGSVKHAHFVYSRDNPTRVVLTGAIIHAGALLRANGHVDLIRMGRHVELLAGKRLPTTVLIAALTTGSTVAPFGAKLERCDLTRRVAKPVQTVVIRLAGFTVEETRWVRHRLREFTILAGGPVGLLCLTAHKRQKYDQNQTKRLAQKNRLKIT